MRPETIDYIKRHPYARTSAIVARDLRNQKTAEIQRENEARRPLARKSLWRRILEALVAIARGWGAV